MSFFRSKKAASVNRPPVVCLDRDEEHCDDDVVKRLQDLCLFTIARNFKVYMLDYYSNEENSKKKKFVTLRRRYSKQLFEYLTLYNRQLVMDDLYVTFLVNPYIEDLDLSGYWPWNIPVLLSALEQAGKKIISLNLSRMELYGTLMNDLLSLLPNLETLCLDHAKILERSLAIIREKCSSLKSLSLLNASTVTNDSIHLLCERDENGVFQVNSNIEHLWLTGTKVNKKGIAFVLEHFESLKSIRSYCVNEALYLLDYKQFIYGVRSLPNYHVQNVNVFMQLDSKILELCAKFFPNLNCISVWIREQDDMDVFLEFSCLEKIELFFDAVGSDVYCPVEFFSSQKSLQLLHLTSPRLSVHSLCHSPRLRTLILISPSFQCSRLLLKRSSSTLPCLRHLKVYVEDFTDDSVIDGVVSIVLSAPKLELLVIQSKSVFTDRGLNLLLNSKSATKLLELDLDFSEICFVSVPTLPKAYKLIFGRRGVSKSEWLRIDKYVSEIEVIS